MSTIIISPHTDDAIFSLGNYMQRFEEVAILSIFSGIPDDPAGKEKHTTLLKEHTAACKIMGAYELNGVFLDDVYQPRPTMEQLAEFILANVRDYDEVIAPIGIHHPDHILVRDTLFRMGIAVDKWYVDLPYGTLYPEEKAQIIKDRQFKTRSQIFESTFKKREAVECYHSQIQSDHIVAEVMVTEEVYD